MPRLATHAENTSPSWRDRGTSCTLVILHPQLYLPYSTRYDSTCKRGHLGPQTSGITRAYLARGGCHLGHHRPGRGPRWPYQSEVRGVTDPLPCPGHCVYQRVSSLQTLPNSACEDRFSVREMPSSDLRTLSFWCFVNGPDLRNGHPHSQLEIAICSVVN